MPIEKLILAAGLSLAGSGGCGGRTGLAVNGDAGTADAEEAGPDQLCEVGETREFYRGPEGTEDFGICHPGTEECVEGADGVNRWQVIQQEVTPSDEIPNDGIDQNCDNYDDLCVPGGELRESYSGPVGTEGVGVCQPRVEECLDRGEGFQYYETQPEILPSEEVCDEEGLDNDCRGLTPAVWWRWNSRIGSETRASSLTQTDGAVVLAGWSSETGSLNTWLVSIDSSGHELWNRIYLGEHDDRIYAVEQTSDRGFVLAGYRAFYSSPDYDALLIRTNDSGGRLWSTTFSREPEGYFEDYIYDMTLTSDGGIVLVGSSSGAWLVKVNPSGDEILWNRTFGGEHEVHFNGVEETSDGGVVLVGSSFNFETGSRDALLTIMDASGHELWTRNYGGESSDYASSVAQTRDGDYVVAGATTSFGAGSWDFWVARIAPSGEEWWSRAYGDEDATEHALSVAETNDEGLIFAGETRPFGPGSRNALVIRTDAFGNVVWTMHYGGEYDDSAFSVTPSSDGDYFLAGWTSFPDSNSWVVRFCEE